jgi:hypothetical protein
MGGGESGSLPSLELYISCTQIQRESEKTKTANLLCAYITYTRILCFSKAVKCAYTSYMSPLIATVCVWGRSESESSTKGSDHSIRLISPSLENSSFLDKEFSFVHNIRTLLQQIQSKRFTK